MSSAPQDVLAEARQKLQILIDAGLSKDILHQLVDSSRSLQLGLASDPSLLLSAHFAPGQFTLPHDAQQQQQQEEEEQQQQPEQLMQPEQPQPQPQPQQQQQHLPAPSSLAIPPAPQEAPPLPPQRTLSSNSSSTSTLRASISVNDAKAEVLSPPDMSQGWSSAPSQSLTTVVEDDSAVSSSAFAPPSASVSHHPRISVSSTSSGSSGHGSIWSVNSARSSLSWASNASAANSTCSRNQAPLPMLPPNATGAPVVNTGLGPNQAIPPQIASKTNIYWCTSCETSFKRKYDWKRHEDEFHERWRKYPCPEPGCNRSFWGSNSFNQHHKQCHGCTTCPHAEKVVKYLRKRKYWACGFCSALHPARERHVEHVARHFESGLTKGDWMHSRVVYGLLHQPLIHEAWDALVQTKQPEYSGRRPQFSWHPSKTGRAQGFLENETAGQLQDLLEFFSGDEGEAQWIVSVAYDLADIVLTVAPAPPPEFAQAIPQSQAFIGQDPRMSFSTIPPQHAQMMQSPDASGSNGFAGFRNTVFIPSQPFAAPHHQQPSPTSSQPSLSSSHSPMMPSPQQQRMLDKRDLPQIPQQHGGMMDFEYSSPPIVFEDWESISSNVMDEASSQHTQGDWNMMQYYAGVPKVTS